MKTLLDTNIFLEVLLGQERADTVKKLLSIGGSDEFYITDFSLHSIGILLFRTKNNAAFNRFVVDMIDGAGIEMLTMPIVEITHVSENAERFNLDFDDAYQYSVAERHGLTMVSFDSDFDRTERKRKTPGELL